MSDEEGSSRENSPFREFGHSFPPSSGADITELIPAWEAMSLNTGDRLPHWEDILSACSIQESSMCKPLMLPAGGECRLYPVVWAEDDDSDMFDDDDLE
jgi:hypothetical protein